MHNIYFWENPGEFFSGKLSSTPFRGGLDTLRRVIKSDTDLRTSPNINMESIHHIHNLNKLFLLFPAHNVDPRREQEVAWENKPSSLVLWMAPLHARKRQTSLVKYV